MRDPECGMRSRRSDPAGNSPVTSPGTTPDPASPPIPRPVRSPPTSTTPTRRGCRRPRRTCRTSRLPKAAITRARSASFPHCGASIAAVRTTQSCARRGRSRSVASASCCSFHKTRRSTASTAVSGARSRVCCARSTRSTGCSGSACSTSIQRRSPTTCSTRWPSARRCAGMWTCRCSMHRRTSSSACAGRATGRRTTRCCRGSARAFPASH